MAQKLYVLFWHFSRTALGFTRTVHYSHFPRPPHSPSEGRPASRFALRFHLMLG